MRRSTATVCACLTVVLLRGNAQALNDTPGAVVSAEAVSWTPHVLDGEVRALAQAGREIVVGGRLWTSTASPAWPSAPPPFTWPVTTAE